MHLCYLDESGNAELSGSTTHFVYLGLAIPAEKWRVYDDAIERVKGSYGLAGSEIHTAWVFRRYLEQESVAGFERMSRDQRRIAVDIARRAILVKAAAQGKKKRRLVNKDFVKSQAYTHLTRTERIQLLRDLADLVGGWDDALIFSEAINKSVFGGQSPRIPPLEEAFERVVTRFHDYLSHRQPADLGLLICDDNQAASLQLTELMRRFYLRGNLFRRQFTKLVETPLFVDSALTGMVQMADLCSFAFRRYHENQERDLLDRVYPRRAQTVGNRVISVRHYTGDAVACLCIVCKSRVRL